MNVFNKKIFGTLTGNVMEFYDFIIYAFLSSYINKLFFSAQDELIGLIMTFGVFASGYLARPIGAIIFGHIGDRYGRKKALIISIFFITISTTMIGLLPTYGSIGNLGPVLLIVCRLIQGFSVSGEQGGAAVYLSENYSNKHKGLLGSLILGSAYFGVLLGSLTCFVLTSICSDEYIFKFAWRIPFLFSFVLGVISLWYRMIISESEDFKREKQKGNIIQNPIGKLFKEQSWQLVTQICLVAALSIPVYLYTVFLPAYLNTILKVPVNISLKVSVISLCFLSIGVPVLGKLSDKIGHKRQFRIGCIILSILAYPTFSLLSLGSIFGIFAGLMLLGGSIFLVAGPVFAILIDSFNIDVRFSGVSIVFNTSMTIFGSTAPMVAFTAIKYFGNNSAPWIYMALSGCIGLGSLYLLRDKKINVQNIILRTI